MNGLTPEELTEMLRLVQAATGVTVEAPTCWATPEQTPRLWRSMFVQAFAKAYQQDLAAYQQRAHGLDHQR